MSEAACFAKEGEAVYAIFDPLFPKAPSNTASCTRAEIGRQGEEAVARLFQQHGWHLPLRNAHIQGGEIDLWAQKGEASYLIEVKTRCAPIEGQDLAQLFSPLKKQRCYRSARTLAMRLGLDWRGALVAYCHRHPIGHRIAYTITLYDWDTGEPFCL